MAMLNRCPGCLGVTPLVPVKTRYRRGGRDLSVTVHLFECPNDCQDPDSGEKLQFVDADQAALNDEFAGRMWREAFGETMPPRRRAGRPTEDARDERVDIRFTSEELATLDSRRGETSRSAYIRAAAVGNLALPPRGLQGEPSGRETSVLVDGATYQALVEEVRQLRTVFGGIGASEGGQPLPTGRCPSARVAKPRRR